MPNKKKKNINTLPPSTGKARWFITYTDLCTLLLTFFVLIFSMSVIDVDRKKAALGSLIGAFKFLPAGRGLSENENIEDIAQSPPPLIKPSSINEQYLAQMASKGFLGPEADIKREEDRIIISLANRFMFEEMSSKLLPDGAKYLAALGSHLKDDAQDIEIRGHVDSLEIMEGTTDRQSLAWKLSTERALAVYRLFLKLGIPPQRMSAHGMSFFHPIVDVTKYPSLRYKNRRVEILLGKNPSIPTSIYSMKSGKTPFFQYKHFFFPLSDGASNNDRKDKTEK